LRFFFGSKSSIIVIYRVCRQGNNCVLRVEIKRSAMLDLNNHDRTALRGG